MISDKENFKSNNTAINDPSPAPVKGKGIATKNNNAIVSYVLTFLSARCRIIGNPQSIAFFQRGKVHKNNSTFLKNFKIKGTRNMFPAIAIINASSQDHPNCRIAKRGTVYRASKPGTIEYKKI